LAAFESCNTTVSAILNGIRAGRTFIDLTASHDKRVDFEARSGGAHARMGETLHAAAGASIHIQIYTFACAGSVVHLLLDGEEIAAAPPTPVDSGTSTVEATLTTGAGRHWLRIEVRATDGTLQLTSSPLYVNF
jgi:hypothetical protein